jgi:HK97 family phage major capsid protein
MLANYVIGIKTIHFFWSIIMEQILNNLKNSIENDAAQLKQRLDGMDASLHDLTQKTAGVPQGWGGTGKKTDFVSQLLSDAGFKAFQSGNSTSFKSTLDLGLKSIISNESGSPAEHDQVLAQATRWPSIIATPMREPRLSEVIPVLPTASASVEFTRESVWTNGAASQQGEGTDKGSTSLEFVVRNDPVRTIATVIEVSNQVMADQPALENYLRMRLVDGLVREMERQIVAGDGNDFTMTGLLDASNHVAYTPVTGEDALESIRKARAQLRANDYGASILLLNPEDAATIDLLKDGQGGYLSGEPRGTDPASLWGLRVIESPAMTKGKFAVSDFASTSVIWDRQSAMVEAFVSADLAKRNVVMLRAELRAAFSVLLPAGVRVGNFD